jgi:hypothetical protein
MLDPETRNGGIPDFFCAEGDAVGDTGRIFESSLIADLIRSFVAGDVVLVGDGPPISEMLRPLAFGVVLVALIRSKIY